MADKDKPKIDLGLLEEDDEFEEFPAEGNLTKNVFYNQTKNNAESLFSIDWAENDSDDEITVWEDNWDDDNVEDDFNQQLKAQLTK